MSDGSDHRENSDSIDIGGCCAESGVRLSGSDDEVLTFVDREEEVIVFYPMFADNRVIKTRDVPDIAKSVRRRGMIRRLKTNRALSSSKKRVRSDAMNRIWARELTVGFEIMVFTGHMFCASRVENPIFDAGGGFACPNHVGTR